jgi:chorismate dehydratase
MYKTKVSVVSYLNSKVFIKGLVPNSFHKFEINLDIPSVCAQKLIENTVDIGLIPVAVIPEITNAKIVSNYCISANGAVNSVFLFSNTELENIHKIYLDKHSRTSNLLCNILANEYWKLEVVFTDETIDESCLKPGEGFVLIGDRTFEKINSFSTQIDLAEHWKAYTGLPFVFAVWVSNKEIEEDILQQFNHLLQNGFEFLTEVIKENKLLNFDVNDYLKNKIEYNLNDEKRYAIELFLKKAALYR